MPYCSECGHPVDGGAAFCTNCGKRSPTSAGAKVPGWEEGATSLEDVPSWLGWLAFLIALLTSIIGLGIYSYWAYRRGRREGIGREAAALPYDYDSFGWRVFGWTVASFVPILGLYAVVHLPTICYKHGLRVGAREGTEFGGFTSFRALGVAFVGILAVAVAALLITALAVGSESQYEVDDRVEALLEDSRQAYEAQGVEQARIDSTFEYCSPGWVKATANNNIDSLIELTESSLADYLSIRDTDALKADAERLLQDFCNSGDAESYCQAMADSMEAHAAGDLDAIGGKESVEEGCLNRYKSDIVAGLEVDVGDCLRETAAGTVGAACSEPGALTVVAIWEIPDSTLPSFTKLDEYALEVCPGDSPLYAYPTEETWAVGDRQIVCLDDR